MGDVRVDLKDNEINVYTNGKYVGMIACAVNPYHGAHCNLKLQLMRYDMDVSTEIFNQIGQKLAKPMKVMISSEEEHIISFLKMAGFICKRKCYEIVASEQDYIGKMRIRNLTFSTVGHGMFKMCSDIMFDRYVLTHADISPWTGSKESFFANLPKKVYYETENEKIRNLAFVEDNEIAYVYGTNLEEFVAFMQSLIAELFAQNRCIMFEADDCDEYAMAIKKLFVNQSEESFDTYILSDIQ